MQKTKDQFTLWVLSGIAGVVVRDLWSFFSDLLALPGFLSGNKRPVYLQFVPI